MLLQQPFPAYSPSLKTLRLTAYAGLVVWLVLALFQPFGFSHLPYALSWLHAFYFGVATFITASTNALLLPRLLPGLFKEETWTTGKELLMMLWQVISISFVNLLLIHVLYGNAFSWPYLLYTLAITAAVGIFPVTLIVLLKQQFLLKKYSTAADRFNQQLSPLPAAVTDQRLHLAGDNQNEQLSIPLSHFRYIIAADNYMKVHYIQAGQPAVAVLRSTLKKAEMALQNYPSLFRCHRAYIVNLAMVEHISGNAQGYKLHIKDIETPIPVSRSLNNELTYLIQQHAPLYQPPQ